MDLNRVRLFLEVADRGSFTSAAAALALPKSSVSRGVARLEADLGVTLLRRTSRTVALTDVGRAYAERARAALRDLDDAATLASDTRAEPAGVVRLTAPPSLDGPSLAAVVSDFVRAHPRVRVELSVTGRFVDLVQDGIDLALRAGRLADSSLVARRVATSPLGLYAAPAYLARRGRPRRLADLADHDCLAYHGPGQVGRWRLDGPGGPRTIAVRGPFACDDIVLLAEACAHGLGVALLPAGLAARAGGDAPLVPVLPGWGIAGNLLWLVHPPARHLPRRVTALRDHLLAALRGP